MREQFKPWSSKVQINQGWWIGAIAAPILLGLAGWFWLTAHQKSRADSPSLLPQTSANLTEQRDDASPPGMGAIATIAGGLFLLFKVRLAKQQTELSHLSRTDLSDLNLNGADFSHTDLNGVNLNGANLNSANLAHANLNGADLSQANLSGADLSQAQLRYANLRGADLRYANLRGADLRHADLSDADLNCALLSDANLSDANLRGALLFFINLRDALNLELLQLQATPAPFLCNAALPTYAQQPQVNPNRACAYIPQLLSDRYKISLEEAQVILYEARQHHWD